MATIEPRLIHLLNTTQTPDLPPIDVAASLSAGESFSLPPLEPAPQQAAQTPDRAFANASLGGSDGHLTTLTYPMKLLLDGPEPGNLTLPVRTVDDPNGPDALAEASAKKRHRAVNAKDDFMQLPQPLKKQKSIQSVAPVPPIIAGLHDPPANAGVFPPITSVTFDETNPVGMVVNGFDTQPILFSLSMSEYEKKKRRNPKPRRKWSVEETNQLLLAVSRHGVGRWTSIMEDPDFTFNDRTAGDLKDRFRTCCPEELRNKPGAHREQHHQQHHHCSPDPDDNFVSDENNQGKADASLAGEDGTTKTAKTGSMLESMFVAKREASVSAIMPALAATPTASATVTPAATGDCTTPTTAGPFAERYRDICPAPSPVDVPANTEEDQPDPNAESAEPVQRKSRAHRKKMEDLAELGISEPFKKSHRRERQPFTDRDDREILEGLDLYGPAWTKIQRDPRFNFANRRPTDLRDRVRNKYPEIYCRIEKGTILARIDAKPGSAAPLEPSVNTSIEKALQHQMSAPQDLSRSSSLEDMAVKTQLPDVSKRIPAMSFHDTPETLPKMANVFVGTPAATNGAVAKTLAGSVASRKSSDGSHQQKQKKVSPKQPPTPPKQYRLAPKPPQMPLQAAYGVAPGGGFNYSVER